MRFKSIAIPAASKGYKVPGKSETVPSQSMSLQEILMRFTRNEALPIGKQVSFHESEDDLEKVHAMDLVDRQEYYDKLEETKKQYAKQEKAKADLAKKQARIKVEQEAREELARKARAQSESGAGASPAKAD